MLSPEHSLPSPLTSSVHLSLEANPKMDFHYMWSTVQTDVELRVAVQENDVPRMRELAKKIKETAHHEHTVATLICEYANRRDMVRCGYVLKYIATHASPMLQFWMAMSHQNPEALRWIGQHDDLARYIFLPMPCPNREWCISNNVDRSNPGPAFKAWWSSQRPALYQAVSDHLRAEWLRRFTAQPKLYYLLNTPTVEQAVFVATRPEPVWDFETLSIGFPDVQSVFNITHALYESVAARKQMVEYFAQRANAIPESYPIAF